jgi:methionyl-tRNA formyltransferase
MRIIFFGSRHASAIPFELRIDHELQLIVTPDPHMVKLAVTEKIPYTQILEINQKFISEIYKLEPDVGVVADFGLIIPEDLINVFPNGILNVHRSLLPKYRGPTPVQTAILNGDEVSGLSIIKIDEHLDHGPIIYQEEYKFEDDDNTGVVLDKLFRRSAELLPDLINRIAKGEISQTEQDDNLATYTKSLKRNDGYVDSENPPEKDRLIRMINGLHPWPGAWTKYTLNNKEVIIKLHPKGIIHVEGKRPMSYKDFANGYPEGKVLLQKLSLI